MNPRQQQALESIRGPLLVLAGAGSGKTSVITRKIAYLIEQCGYDPRHVMAVTFTNKAAREMKERVGKLLGSDRSKGLTVSTFHNFGLNFIRKEHKVLEMKANFTIFDQQDAMALLRDLGYREGDSDKSKYQELQQQISNWKNDMVLPDQAAATAENQDIHVRAKIYEAYVRSMRAYNAVDFDDLILLPGLLLRDNAEVRERWQARIRYLLVDEYQDTNTSQYELVKLLCGAAGDFTVVGDDDQSIYSWRGAQPENLELLQKDYPRLDVVKLEQNYRSCGRILKAANTLIANNPHVFEKKLWSDKVYGEELRVLQLANEEDEAQRVVGEIISRRLRTPGGYRDFAILYRSNHQARILEKTLMANQVPYRISGSTSFFSRAEVKDVMAYLRLLVNQDDDNAFLRIVNTPKREIGPSTLEKLGLYAQRRSVSLYEACFEMGLEQVLPGRGLLSIRKFAETIGSAADNARRGDTIGVIHDLISRIGYHGYLHENANTPKAAEYRWNNIMELLGWVEKSLEEYETSDDPLQVAVNNLLLRDMLERNEEEDNDNQVQLMTLHAGKGLEFPHVYLVGMEEELLPHKSSIEAGDIEEERRLAYVGITRAQQTLTFTLCRKRSRFGEEMRCEPSRFLAEIPEDDLDWEGKGEPVSAEQKKEKDKASIAGLRAMLAQ